METDYWHSVISDNHGIFIYTTAVPSEFAQLSYLECISVKPKDENIRYSYSEWQKEESLNRQFLSTFFQIMP